MAKLIQGPALANVVLLLADDPNDNLQAYASKIRRNIDTCSILFEENHIPVPDWTYVERLLANMKGISHSEDVSSSEVEVTNVTEPMEKCSFVSTHELSTSESAIVMPITSAILLI